MTPRRVSHASSEALTLSAERASATTSMVDWWIGMCESQGHERGSSRVMTGSRNLFSSERIRWRRDLMTPKPCDICCSFVIDVGKYSPHPVWWRPMTWNPILGTESLSPLLKNPCKKQPGGHLEIPFEKSTWEFPWKFQVRNRSTTDRGAAKLTGTADSERTCFSCLKCPYPSSSKSQACWVPSHS